MSPAQEEALKPIVQVKADEYFKEGLATADAKNIQDWIGWRGRSAKVDSYVTEVPGAPGMLLVHYKVEEKQPDRVGQVFIVGNDVTQDRIIRRLLGLYPGQPLRYPELRFAENNLKRSGYFETKGEDGPEVKVINPDSVEEFKDIFVRVKETTTGSFMIGAGINSNTGVMGSIVLNERNFDPFRLPTSWADVL